MSAWSSGICGCCDDCRSCCCGIWCPCILAGENIEIISRGGTSKCTGCCLTYLLMMIQCECFYTCGFRKSLRGQYNLPEAPCNDCCTHWCCFPCALCQEYRELKARGMDPQFGWAAVQAQAQAQGNPGGQKMQR